MKFKKLTTLILAGAMVLSLAACGGSGDTTTGGDAAGAGTEATDNAGGDAAGGDEAGGDTAAAEDNSGAAADAASSAAGALKPNQDPANTNTSDETVRVDVGSEPSVIWGAAAGKTENQAEIITGALLDTLVRQDQNTQEVLPNLATAWEWVDGTHCKFTLRDDVTMSDGTPLVADDVVYCVNMWKEVDATNDYGKYLVGAVADDEHTVTIEYTVAAPDLVAMMSWAGFGIVSEDEVNAAGGLEAASKAPTLGCGMYKFVSWEQGKSVTIERNEDYWNPDRKAYFKTVVFTFTADAAAREMAVESGDIDVAYEMPVAQAANFVGSDKVSTYLFSSNQVAHLWYNMGENAGATKDQLVREAIDMALDFDAIASVATAGFGKAADAYMDPAATYYTQTLTPEQRAVDIEGAKAKLAEAGYADGLELKMLGLSDGVAVMTVIQGNLQQVGITLTIDTPDVAQFVEAAFGGDYDIVSVGDNVVTRTPTIYPFVTKLNVEGPGMVIGGPKWTTDELDAAVATLISETDESKLADEAKAIDDILQGEMVCSNLYSEMKAVITAKDLKGYSIRERGYVDVTALYK